MTSGGPFQHDYAMMLWPQDHLFVLLPIGDRASNEEEGLSFPAEETGSMQELSGMLCGRKQKIAKSIAAPARRPPDLWTPAVGTMFSQRCCGSMFPSCSQAFVFQLVFSSPRNAKSQCCGEERFS